ncbi:hypothetical protein C3941_14740 [Kaistia algarum]|nr:hypothetical protein C3941_14740 [Kaistia algarum]
MFVLLLVRLSHAAGTRLSHPAGLSSLDAPRGRERGSEGDQAWVVVFGVGVVVARATNVAPAWFASVIGFETEGARAVIGKPEC